MQSIETKDIVGYDLFYYEFTLLANQSRVYIDFSNSNRTQMADANMVASKNADQPLKQIKITNDGTADFIRIGVNAGPAGAPYVKIKFGETLTIPFVDTDEVTNNITLQAITSNATVRIIGLA
jgi:hypothetical protein